MPTAVVKTKRDEELWEKAKQRVVEEYGLTEADGDRYWRLVMGIFRRMKGLRKKLLLVFRKAKHLSPKYRVGEVVRVAVDGFDFAPRARIVRVYWKPHSWWYDCIVLPQPEVGNPFDHSVPESEVAPVSGAAQEARGRKRALVVVRKAGDHWRDQPRAPKGGHGKYKGGQWIPQNTGADLGTLKLRPIGDLETAIREFERLYVNRRPLLRALDPTTGRRTIRVVFRPASAHHAVTKDTPDTRRRARELEETLGRRLTKQERERLRVFAPERAARIHWIEAVLSDPDEVWEAVGPEGRTGYLFRGRQSPDAKPYVVFVQQRKRRRDIVEFVTAYPVEGTGSPEELLRLRRCLYRRGKQSPPATKGLLAGRKLLCRVIQRLAPPGRLQEPLAPASPGSAGTIIPAWPRTRKAVVVVRPYQRHTPSGRIVQVRPHERHVSEAPRGHTPDDLQKRYRAEADRFVLRAADDLPLLVRQFGSGKQRGYTIHAPNGQHIGTLHAKLGSTSAEVSGGWTHPDWRGRGVHTGVLRRLIGEAGEVRVPARLSGVADDAVAMREAGHPVRSTDRGWAVRAAGERALSLFAGSSEQSPAHRNRALKELNIASIEGQGVAGDVVDKAARELADVMRPLRRFGIDGRGKLRVVVRGSAKVAEYEPGSTTIFIGKGINSLAHEVGHFVAHGLMEGWFGPTAHPADLLRERPGLRAVQKWMLDAVGHLPRGQAWASNPQEVWAVAFEAWANGTVKLAKAEMPQEVVRQARAAVNRVLEAVQPHVRQGRLFKGARLMSKLLVVFGPLTRLLKGRVRGYYRRDPRTGQQVYVKPHERRSAEQLSLPIGDDISPPRRSQSVPAPKPARESPGLSFLGLLAARATGAIPREPIYATSEQIEQQRRMLETLKPNPLPSEWPKALAGLDHVRQYEDAPNTFRMGAAARIIRAGGYMPWVERRVAQYPRNPQWQAIRPAVERLKRNPRDADAIRRIVFGLRPEMGSDNVQREAIRLARRYLAGLAGLQEEKGALFKGNGTMGRFLMAFGPLARLIAKARRRVRGYYRTDPRTGKRVYVKPYEREVGQLALPLFEQPASRAPSTQAPARPSGRRVSVRRPRPEPADTGPRGVQWEHSGSAVVRGPRGTFEVDFRYSPEGRPQWEVRHGDSGKPVAAIPGDRDNVVMRDYAVRLAMRAAGIRGGGMPKPPEEAEPTDIGRWLRPPAHGVAGRMPVPKGDSEEAALARRARWLYRDLDETIDELSKLIGGRQGAAVRVALKHLGEKYGGDLAAAQEEVRRWIDNLKQPDTDEPAVVRSRRRLRRLEVAQTVADALNLVEDYAGSLIQRLGIAEPRELREAAREWAAENNADELDYPGYEQWRRKVLAALAPGDRWGDPAGLRRRWASAIARHLQRQAGYKQPAKPKAVESGAKETGSAKDPARQLADLAEHLSEYGAYLLRQAILLAGKDSYQAIRRAGYSDLANDVAVATERVVDWMAGEADRPWARAWKLLSHPLTLQRVIERLEESERESGRLARVHQENAERAARGDVRFDRRPPEEIQRQEEETAAYYRALEREARRLAQEVQSLKAAAERQQTARAERKKQGQRRQTQSRKAPAGAGAAAIQPPPSVQTLPDVVQQRAREAAEALAAGKIHAANAEANRLLNLARAAGRRGAWAELAEWAERVRQETHRRMDRILEAAGIRQE